MWFFVFYSPPHEQTFNYTVLMCSVFFSFHCDCCLIVVNGFSFTKERSEKKETQQFVPFMAAFLYEWNEANEYKSIIFLLWERECKRFASLFWWHIIIAVTSIKANIEFNWTSEEEEKNNESNMGRRLWKEIDILVRSLVIRMWACIKCFAHSISFNFKFFIDFFVCICLWMLVCMRNMWFVRFIIYG